MQRKLKHILLLTVIITVIAGLCQISYGAEMTYSNGKLEVSGLDSSAKAYGSYSDGWRMSGTATYIKKNGKWIWSTTTQPQGR